MLNLRRMAQVETVRDSLGCIKRFHGDSFMSRIVCRRAAPALPALSSLLCLCLSLVATGAERLRVEIRETGGWSRPAYPCTLKLDRPPSSRPVRFRLLDENERPVVLQTNSEQRENSVRWWLAFPVTLTPFQRRVFTLEIGPEVPRGPERKRGHVVDDSNVNIRIINAPYLTWTVPKTTRSFLQSLHFGGHEHIKGPTGTVVLTQRGGGSVPLSQSARWQVVRRGPLSVTLVSQQAVRAINDARATAHIQLEFPVSRSWVKMDLRLEDPADAIANASLAVQLNLDLPTPKAPTLVDFGANTSVYTRLSSGEAARLQIETVGTTSRWQVSRGRTPQLKPFVVSPPSRRDSTAEGWAHLMDRTRCLALAVGNFGREQIDSIHTTAEGRITVRRKFSRRPAAAPRTKRLSVWLHFVAFPPQQSAATSPQHMQTPPTIQILR